MILTHIKQLDMNQAVDNMQIVQQEDKDQAMKRELR